MEQRYVGKTVMVVGCAQGIGKAVAEKFAKEGARLALFDIQDTRDEVKESIRTAYDVQDIIADYIDISDYESCLNAAKITKEKFGGIDVLAVVSGILPAEGSVVDTPIEMWQKVINVNLNGYFYITKAVAPIMMKQGYGNIIMTASGWGHTGVPYFASYCCSKGAVIKLTQVLSQELADYGIRVNNVCPGSTATELHLEAIAVEAKKRGISIEEMKKIDYSRMAMKRAGYPSEIADAFAYLGSEQASYITGVSLDVNGGGYFH